MGFVQRDERDSGKAMFLGQRLRTVKRSHGDISLSKQRRHMRQLRIRPEEDERKDSGGRKRRGSLTTADERRLTDEIKSGKAKEDKLKTKGYD